MLGRPKKRRKLTLRAILLLASLGGVAALAAGCMVAAPASHSGAGALAEMRPAPPASPSTNVSVSADYRIHPGDLVEIRFPFHREENTEAQVRPDGRIGLPLIGEVSAAGLKPEELAQIISERASSLLVDPVVAVTVRRFGEQKVYVGGEVKNPGFVPYYPGLTPLLAVIHRGGFRPTADPEHVVWISAASAENHQVQETNLEAVISGDATEKVVLGPDDVVYVPSTTIGKMNNFVDLYVRGLIPTLPRPSFRIPP